MERILIIDFGSQYTHLIAKEVRKNNVYSDIVPYNKLNLDLDNVKGVILSGSPHSVIKNTYPTIDLDLFKDLPILGICYGSQVIAKKFGEKVVSSGKREFGKHIVNVSPNFFVHQQQISVWMSHNDTIVSENNINVFARTDNNVIAAFRVKGKKIFGLQFHPEVSHTEFGDIIFKNFIELCEITTKYTIPNYKEKTIQSIKEKVGDDKVLMAVSGGVDSTVVARLLYEAIGNNLLCVFIDNGLLRENEVEDVEKSFQKMGLNLKTINATNSFYFNFKKYRCSRIEKENNRFYLYKSF